MKNTAHIWPLFSGRSKNPSDLIPLRTVPCKLLANNFAFGIPLIVGKP